MQMQTILSRSIRGFFRRSNAAYFPALSPPLHRFSHSSRFLPDSMASASFRRQGATRMAAPNPLVPCISRFRGGSSMASNGGVKGEELDQRYSTQGVGNEYDGQTIKESIAHPDNCEDGVRAETEFDDEVEEDMEGVTDTDEDSEAEDYVPRLHILHNSTHRDGSIYRNRNWGWKGPYRITDRNETRVGPMMFPDKKNGSPGPYMQFFAIKLAKIPMGCGPVELYGYIATRDCLDPLLNYIVNISRDDPIIAEQGSLIEMIGPRRGIYFYGNILLEYDMRIKIGDQEADDLQLIDGVTSFDDITPISGHVYPRRIRGDCGAVDITKTFLSYAVEATVDVLVSEVRTGFNLSLSSFFSGLPSLFNELPEIQLFRGAVGESRDLRRRFVTAVTMNTQMRLKFEVGVGRDTAEHSCSFKANTQGRASQQIITEFASISVTVTWSTQPRSPCVLSFASQQERP